MALSHLYGDAIEQLGTGSAMNSLGKALPSCAGFKAFVNHSTRACGDNIPALGFRLAGTHFSAGFCIGMYLNAEYIFCVQQLDKQWKRAVNICAADDFCGKSLHKRTQGLSLKGAVCDNGLAVGQIGQFPALADGLVAGQGFAEQFSEPASAPDSLLKERFKCQRI